LKLGKYEFYPNDRHLLEELLHEIRELRRDLRRSLSSQVPDETVLDNEYAHLAKAEEADPNYFDWIEN
jgi:hypothetical protein